MECIKERSIRRRSENGNILCTKNTTPTQPMVPGCQGLMTKFDNRLSFWPTGFDSTFFFYSSSSAVTTAAACGWVTSLGGGDWALGSTGGL